MADKRTRLEIVIGAIDKATATVSAIQRRINAIAVLSAPISLIGERLGGLAKAAGLPKLVEGFKGVGGAVKDTLGKLAMVGGIVTGVVAGAVAGLKSLVDEFDGLGDKAETIGVSVDFLAQMRYAAERSGAEVKALDGGLQGFAKSLGQARAGTGRMATFLGKVSPALLRQLKAAKGNEAAFDLLAGAMAKIEDPAKRAALAQATLGDASLAPLFAKGADGIKALRDRYAELAGSQQGAADAAGATDDAMKDFKASTDGVKAALVSGLAPALKDIVERLREFFTENRPRIAEIAAELGKKIPGAVTSAIGAFKKIVGFITPFVDEGWKLKLALAAVAAVIVGPMIASIVSLGIAIAATPVGWILAGIVAIAAGAYFLITRWDTVKAFLVGLWDTLGEKFGWARTVIAFALAPIIGFPLALVSAWGTIKEFFVALWDGITGAFESAWESISGIVDKITGAVSAVTDAIASINPFADDAPTVAYAPGAGQLGGLFDRAAEVVSRSARASEARVSVDFANAPTGTRVNADPRNTATVDMTVGYQMGLMP